MGIDFDTAEGGTCFAHDPSVLGERFGVSRGAKLVQELGGALDVGEEEG